MFSHGIKVFQFSCACKMETRWLLFCMKAVKLCFPVGQMVSFSLTLIKISQSWAHFCAVSVLRWLCSIALPCFCVFLPQWPSYPSVVKLIFQRRCVHELSRSV